VPAAEIERRIGLVLALPPATPSNLPLQRENNAIGRR
jgi:hypothetical protein